MALKNTSTEFGWLAKALHWLIAIGIFYLIYLGLSQSDMERGPARLAIRSTHASWALLVLTLMTVRLIWRVSNPTPAHPDGAPIWQGLLATVVHWAIYLTVFVQLSAGAMTVATGGRGIPFFGLFTIPLPVEQSEDAHHFWEDVHKNAWKLLAALLVVHILAALYHHFIAKNDVLRRMTVGTSNGRSDG